MSVYDEINSAIAAHAKWKNKLKNAIETGACESTPEKVKQDNNCSFGKWLHFRIDSDAKNSKFYDEIVKLHAEFHREAGLILELGLDGNKEEAYKLLKLGGKYISLSSQLTLKMTEWRDSL